MQVGIVGPGSSGKTTLFNALTRGSAATSAYGGRREVNVGVIQVPDPRFDWLVDLYHPRKVTPATIEFVDGMGGQEAGERRGDLGADFYATVRRTDALALVVRAFEDEMVPHPKGRIDPVADAHAVVSELILADLQAVERRLERLEKLARGAKADRAQTLRQIEIFQRLREALEEERTAREVGLTEEEQAAIRDVELLTDKTIVLVLNIGEDQIGQETPTTQAFAAYAAEHGYTWIALCAKVEAEVAQLEPEEESEFLEAMGIEEPARNRFIRVCYGSLGLISFFTVGEDEVRAWTIRKESTAVQAAGKIHSDLARGFIRAETLPYERLRETGSWNAAKEKGYLRLEGKEYRVQDGDILHIRFQV
ncbi:MAG TPA: redox-regulated ATPase YchF [Armatimonadetes bacterium]|jgi:GTP-binding protein YchF|nr:redox-regulated ATPase YchF [Armatimonadota bacterium]